MAAERISERVDAGDRRIGEGEAGEMRAEQHRRARLEIAGLLAWRSADWRDSSRSASRASASDSGFLSRAEV